MIDVGRMDRPERPVNAHAFRMTYLAPHPQAMGKVLVNAGHSLYEVQQALGHSDPKVTMRYGHLSKDSLHQAANSASKQIMAAMGA